MRIVRLGLPVALLGFFGGAPAAEAQLAFSGPSTFPVAPNPDRLVVADFNGDNDLDAAVTTSDAPALSILVGGPGATFGSPTAYDVGSNPEDIAVGDFNADGDPDLAVAEGSDRFFVLVGGAGASFGTPTPVSTSESPQDIVVGNFNGDQDQDPDIAMSSGNGLVGVISVHLGGTGATFGGPTDISNSGLLRSLVSRDFNADGDPDLAVADTNNDEIAVLLGQPGGGFAAPTYVAVTGAAYIDSGDFDGNGDPDIAVTNFSGDPAVGLHVLTGDSGGAFSAPQQYTAGPLSLGIAVGHIDADADLDVATADNSGPHLSVLTGGPGATFVPAATLGDGSTQPRDVVIGDFDGDGKADLAATGEDPLNGIMVFVNTGAGAGAAPPPPSGGALPRPVLGRLVNASVVKGKVLIAVPARGAHAARAGASQKGLKFVPLTEDRQIPVGSYLDTRRGTVALESATGSAGKTQSGNFTSGIFQVLQSRKKRDKGMTELRLKGATFNTCRKSRRGKRASAARLSSRTIRQLKANAKGRFRTRGRQSAATVRGTAWITADRCDGTLTKVTRGKVAVRDFRRKKTVLVRAGKSYLAKAPG